MYNGRIERSRLRPVCVMSNTPPTEGEPERCWFCNGLIVPENIAPEGEYGCRVCGVRVSPGSISISKEAALRFLNEQIAELRELATSGVSRAQFGERLVETLHLCLAAKGVMYWQRQSSFWPFAKPLPKLEFSYGRTKSAAFAAELIQRNAMQVFEADLYGEPILLIGVLVLDKKDRSVGVIEVIRNPEPDPDKQLFYLKVAFHVAEIAATCPAMLHKG